MPLSPGCSLESLGELWYLGPLADIHYICIFKSAISNSGDFERWLRLRPLNFLGHFISGFLGCTFPVFYLNTAVICHSLMLVHVWSYVCPITMMGLTSPDRCFVSHLRSARVSVPSEKHFLSIKVTSSLWFQWMGIGLIFNVVLCLASLPEQNPRDFQLNYIGTYQRLPIVPCYFKHWERIRYEHGGRRLKLTFSRRRLTWNRKQRAGYILVRTRRGEKRCQWNRVRGKNYRGKRIGAKSWLECG